MVIATVPSRTQAEKPAEKKQNKTVRAPVLDGANEKEEDFGGRTRLIYS
jgi:hypothetical protein